MINFISKRSETILRRKIFLRCALYAAIGLGVLSLLAGLLFVPLLGAAREAKDAAGNARAAFTSALTSLTNLDPAGAEEALQLSESEFARSLDTLRAFSPFERAPFIGDNIRAAQALAAAGRDLAQAGNLALQESEALFPLLVLDGTDTKISLLQSIAVAAPVLGELRDRLTEIDERVSAIPSDGLTPPLLEARREFAGKLAEAREAVEAMGPLVRALPHFAGYPEEHTALILFQNETELRPTGGFWGTYGLATFSGGELKNFQTDDIYALDGPAESFLDSAPPEPLRKYLGVSRWFLRDANWSPDFAVSARQGLDFFARETKNAAPTPHAIVGITSAAVAKLLTVTGDIEIDGVRFTPENFTETLEFEVERGFVSKGIARGERKDVIGRLGDELIARLEHLTPQDALRALMIVAEAFSEKHVLVFDLDTEVQDALREARWSGELPSPTGDFFMAVDANLASLKSDPAVARSIQYSVQPSKDGNLLARLAITYDHHGSFNWKTTRYRTYTRVYVPRASRLVSVSGAMENDRLLDPARRPGEASVGEEGGLAVFGAFISIEPGDSGTLVFTYELPAAIAEQVRRDGDYTLTAFKQAGTSGHPLTLDLKFGKNLRYAAPAEDEREQGDDRYRFQTDLRVDREFVVQF